MDVRAGQKTVSSVYPPFDMTAVYSRHDGSYEVWHNNTMVGVAPDGTLLSWDEVKA
jgi:hypothetical protein